MGKIKAFIYSLTKLDEKEIKKSLKSNKIYINEHYPRFKDNDTLQILTKFEKRFVILMDSDTIDIRSTNIYDYYKRFTFLHYKKYEKELKEYCKIEDRKNLLKKYFESNIKNSLKALFPEERYSIQKDGRVIEVIVHYPEITTYNELDELNLMRDVFVKYRFDSTSYRLLGIYMMRTTYSDKELLSNYCFSHLNASANYNDWSNDFCFGSTPLSEFMNNIKMDEGLINSLYSFEQLFSSFGEYLTWESISGGAYNYIADLKKYHKMDMCRVSHFNGDDNINLYSDEILKSIDDMVITPLCTDEDSEISIESITVDGISYNLKTYIIKYLIENKKDIELYYKGNFTKPEYNKQVVDRKFNVKVRDGGEFYFKDNKVEFKMIPVLEEEMLKEDIEKEMTIHTELLNRIENTIIENFKNFKKELVYGNCAIF